MTPLSDAEIAELEAARLATLGLYYSRNAMERYLELLLDAGPALIAAAKAQRDDGWRTMESAPKDGLVLLLLGETIPDHPLVEVGRYIDGHRCEKQDFREYAKYGGWLIWNADDNWYVCDVAEPLGWRPLPAPPSPQETE